MKIYTKTGDKGETGLIGKRISKNSKIIEAIGHLDELNAHIGLIISALSVSKNNKLFSTEILTLEKIQSLIFSIGAVFAGGKITIDFSSTLLEIEDEIDLIESKVPALINFILPGGSICSAQIHVARAVCRRCERRLVDVQNENVEEFSEILKIMNRLSDYFFVLARLVNKIEGNNETIWKG